MTVRNLGWAVAWPGLALLLQLAAVPLAQAQQYVVSEEENDARPTVYTLRNNWSQPPGREYHNTTMIRDGTTNACGEFPCLDDGEPGDLPPNGKRNGTATAVITGMVAGTYKIEFFFRQSDNRSTSVPWRITTDAASNNSRAANINQQDATTWGTDEGWRILASSDVNPVAVTSRLTFVFGSDTLNFSGSISYGGIRATRITVAPHDAGSTGLCQGIVAAGYELCEQTATTCSGVYANGEGCVQYCAAAGMLCSSRYGASVGCVIELQNPFACNADNGQLSNWCNCTLPAQPDASRPDAWRPDANRPDTWRPDAWAPDRAMVDQGDRDDAAIASDGAIVPDAARAEAAHAADVVHSEAGAPLDGAADIDTNLVVTTGCGCRATGNAAATSPWVMLSIAALGWSWRRRSR